MRVMHSFPVDFSTIKPGQFYNSYCGKRYIAEAPPTEEEAKEILQEWSDVPRCKKCEKVKKKLAEEK